MDKLVQRLGISSLFRSQVSGMAKELAASVEQFRTRQNVTSAAVPCSTYGPVPVPSGQLHVVSWGDPQATPTALAPISEGATGGVGCRGA